MDERTSYEKRLEAELNEWAAKINVLKAKAEKFRADAEINLDQEIKRIEKKKAQAAEQLRQLREAKDDAWSDLKGGLEKAWADVGDAINSAVSRFK